MIKIVELDELYDVAQDLGEVANICPKDIKAHSWYCEDHYVAGCCDKTKCWEDFFEEHSWGGGEIPEEKLYMWQQNKPLPLEEKELQYELGWLDGWGACKKVDKVLYDRIKRQEENK